MIEDIFSPSTDRTPERSEKHQHDLTLVDLKMIFENLKCVLGLYGENEYHFSNLDLKSNVLDTFRSLNCDGLLRVKINETALDIALEFENQRQNPAVYEKKIQKIYTSHVVANIFISSSDVTLRSLKSVEKAFLEKQSSTPKIFYALLEDVLHYQNEMTFSNIKEQKLVLR